jgi:thymidylate synthase ThyX
MTISLLPNAFTNNFTISKIKNPKTSQKCPTRTFLLEDKPYKIIPISKKGMKVTLINYSQPSPSMVAQGCQTLLDMVAFCARVSNPDNQFVKETNERLVAYLMRNHHWSPFEMVTICLEI